MFQNNTLKNLLKFTYKLFAKAHHNSSYKLISIVKFETK